MPARDQQRQCRCRQHAVLEGVGGDVPGEVVHAVQRHVPGRRVGLGRGHPHQQRTGQPRAAGHGDGIDVAVAQPGIGERGADGGRHRLQVCTGGDLRHHSTEPGVLVLAGGERVAEQFRRPVGDPDQAGACFVAGRFDAQHDRADAGVAAVIAAWPW